MSQGYSIKQIGEGARRIISTGNEAHVQGISSRGVFLQVDGREVIFLSGQAEPGPLTLSLAGQLPNLTHEAQAQIQKGVLLFESQEVIIDTTPAVTWRPPVRPLDWLSWEDRQDRLHQAARLLWEGKERPSALLAVTLDQPLAEPEGHLGAAFSSLREAWQQARSLRRLTPELATAAENCLGLGGGLTPSGDDLLGGLLLALNRWGEVCAPGFPVQELNEVILRFAPQSTTALSTSLLRWAAEGQASQRLITALDGLVSGRLGLEVVVRSLQGYGASSGADTLVGFGLVCG